jgi:accessory gene regulator protein AgrB
MSKAPPLVPYSPEDMKRRKRRSVIMALGLAVLVTIFFVTTLVRLGAHVADKVM